MKKRVVVVSLLIISISMGACEREKQNNSASNSRIFLRGQEEETQIELKENLEHKDTILEEIPNGIGLEEVTEEAETDLEEKTEEPDAKMDEEELEVSVVNWNNDWQYADCSVLHSDSVTLYRSISSERKDVVVTVNAGHGTSGGAAVMTLCHPDGSEKVTGGSTPQGAIRATAVSTGTTMLDGTPEAKVTLSLALLVKEMLLNNGYDVLMIRETDDVQIDNVARTVYANNNSDCHIALHYNSTESDAGFFYIGVPDIESYKAMEPVASYWQEHNSFGVAILEGMKAKNMKICGTGVIEMDLTQTSYSTVPSTDVEVGDRGSDYSRETQQKIAEGILEGLNIWYNQR